MKSLMTEAKTLLDDPTQVEDEDLPKKIEQSEGHIAKLKNATKNVEEDNQQWLDHIGRMKVADREAEYEAYSEVAFQGDNAIIPMVEQARDTLDLLMIRKKRQISTQSRSHEEVSAGRKTAKLHSLEMPTFTGDTLRWNEFWALFAANVDSVGYDKTVKLAYLRSYLRGAAFDAISGLDIADESYDVTIQLLKKRFAKTPEQLIGTLYSKLKALPRSTMKTKDIRHTHDACEKIIRQLKSAGENIAENRTLVIDLLSKYPESLIEEVTKLKKVDIRSTLEITQKALGEYIEQLELIDGLKLEMKPFNQFKSERSSYSDNPQRREEDEQGNNDFHRNKWKHRNRDDERNYKQFNESSALTTADTRSTESRQPSRPCIFCSGEHFNSNCELYPTFQARKSRLEELGRCYRCQYSGHEAADCKTAKYKINCFHCKARGKHWSPLCPTIGKSAKDSTNVGMSSNDKGNGKKASGAKKKTTGGQEQDAGSPTVSTLSIEERSVLSTAVATISNPATGATRLVKIILDNGSNRSYIKEEAIQSLQLPSENTSRLNLSTFGLKKSSVFQSQQVTFDLHLKDGKQISIVANSTNLITNCSVTPALSSSMMEELNAMKYALADDLENNNPPEVLIGSDYFWEIISGARIKTEKGLYYIPTTLGLVLGGRYSATLNGQGNENEPNLLCIFDKRSYPCVQRTLPSCRPTSKKIDEETDIDDFWKLERIGIYDDPTENEDATIRKRFEDTVEFDGERYQVQLPWKPSWNELPTNYQLANGRLQSLVKRLSKCSEDFWQQYSKVIAQQLDKGVIEKVPPEEINGTTNIVHYVAHHPVIKKDSETTKCRIVYDASAKCGSNRPSLNECLHRGPVILPDLCAILLRFRLGPIAITSDLEKAFLQVGLQPSQGDAFRFLWLKTPEEKTTVNNIEVYRFTRVPFGSISSPFLLGATIVHHMKKIGTTMAHKVKDNIYTDNVIVTVPTVEDGVTFYNETKKMFEKAGMNLQQYQTNSNDLHDRIPEEDRCGSRVTKVLGMVWDSQADCMQLQRKWKNQANPITKREILKLIASVFDPLGLFQPATLKMKLLLRDVWNSTNNEWDTKLPEEMQSKWLQLYEETMPIFNVKFERNVSAKAKLESASLVVFSDASAEAYGAAVYLRIPTMKHWKSTLVYAKSRLAPKVKWKPEVTIPRLELLGLTIAVKIGLFARRALGQAEKMKLFVFSDSSSILGWLTTTRKLDIFVENRVTGIRSTDNAEFRFVKGEENPADLITRGLAGEDLRSHSLWWNGPDFLKEDVDNWPVKTETPPITSEELQKVAKKVQEQSPLHHAALSKSPREGPDRKSRKSDERTTAEESTTTVTGISTNAQTEDLVGALPFDIKAERYSSLRKLLRVTTLCQLFLGKLWARLPSVNRIAYPGLNALLDDVNGKDTISAYEISTAKRLWIQKVQNRHYKEVKVAIEKKAKNSCVTTQYST